MNKTASRSIAACVDGCMFGLAPNRTELYIPQRGVQWKQGVVIYRMLYTSLLYNTTPIHCTPLPLHPPVMNAQERCDVVDLTVLVVPLCKLPAGLHYSMICVCMCTYICMYVCICIYIYICIHIHTYIDICCMCVYTYIYIYIYVYICRSCVYIYIYIMYSDMYIPTYIYTYT